MFLTNFCRWHCSRIWSMSLCASVCRSGAGPRQKSFVWGTSCSYWWFRGPENLSWPESSTIINVNFTKNYLENYYKYWWCLSLISRFPLDIPVARFDCPVCPLCDQISMWKIPSQFLVSWRVCMQWQFKMYVSIHVRNGSNIYSILVMSNGIVQ